MCRSLSGQFPDKLGRRPVILWGVALFLVATLGCLFAPTAEIFLFFRMCQAIVAAAMVLSRAAVRDIYDGPEAASMIGYVTMGMAVVPMIGPVIGGFLEESMGWQANFWLLMLLGGATFAITYFDLGETAAKSGKTLIAGQFREYPELAALAPVLGVFAGLRHVVGCVFCLSGRRALCRHPDLRADRSRAGRLLSTPAIGYFLGNFVSGRFSTRIGVNQMVLRGCIINSVGVGVSMALARDGAGQRLFLLWVHDIGGAGQWHVHSKCHRRHAISVRPHLAGTASGLAGAIMIGVGAGLSAYAGYLLGDGATAAPLLELMMATAVLGFASIIVVIRRERQLGL